MANTNYVQLPAIIGLDGTEVVSLVQPGTSAGTDKKATTRQLLAAVTPLSGPLSPTTDWSVTVTKSGLAYSTSVSDFMTALHGVPGGGTTGQILGKTSNTDYDIAWVNAGTVFSVGLSMPAVFSVANSPITSSGTFAVTANGTSGGIPYFNAPTTMASSGVLAANQIVLGGGAAATPATLGSLGTTTTVLHGNAAGAPTFGAVDLTADVTGTLPVGKGGTGVAAITAHYLLVGNGTSAATLLAPSATSGIPLVSQGASADPAYSTAVVAGGGTGLTSATAYAVLCGGTTSTGAFQSVASVGTAGQLLTSNGASLLPTFQTLTTAGLTVGTSTITSGTTTRVLYDNAGVLGEYAQIPLAVGGTNANLTASNGGIFYSTASAGAILAGTATANQLLMSGASTTPAWSTATYPATAAVGTVLNASGANVLAATTTPTLGASGTLGTLAFGNATSGTVKLQPVAGALGSSVLTMPAITDTLAGLALANGGTNASLTASNGGIVYSTASAMAILSGTATANQVLLAGSSTTPAWSTATYPATTTINQLLYSSSGNVIAGLATANNGVLITSGGGVPSISSTIPAATQANITGTGTLTSGSTGAGFTVALGSSTITGQLALANGGTAANLTASNGGIFYSTVSAGAILAGTATANLPLLSGSSTTPSWASVSHPTSATSGGIPYFSSTSVMATSGLLTQFGPVYGGGSAAAPVSMAAGTDGQLIVGQTSAAPLWKTASGDLTVAASGAFTIANNAVTLAKLATQGSDTVLANITAGTAVPTAATLTAIIDACIANANVQGAVLYRSASVWSALQPQASGKVLTTGGSGADPSWTSISGTGTVVSVITSTQGLTVNGFTATTTPGGSFTSSGTITPLQTVNAQTGTSYTVDTAGAGAVPSGISADHAKLITFSNASPVAVTLPSIASNLTALGLGFYCDIENKGAGLVTLTPTTSTIGGATVYYLGTNQSVRITSDGTNYQVTDRNFYATAPNGRLTLTTATPIMTSTTSAQTTVYFTPYLGSMVPVYNGSNFQWLPFAEMSQTTSDTTKSPAAVGTQGSATNVPSAYDVFVWVDSGTMRATRGPSWSYGTSGTAIISTATPAVVTWNSHGLSEGAAVVLTGSTLPTGLSANTVYYVTRSPSANSFTLSTTIANAAAGTTVGGGGSSSGTQTVTNYDGSTTNTAPRSTGAGTTELQMVNGIWTNKVAITNGPGANKGTYVGSIRCNASSQIDWIFGAVAAGGTAGSFNVWNMYNRVMVGSIVGDSTDSWTVTSGCQAMDAGGTGSGLNNRISFLMGLAEDECFGSVVHAGHIGTGYIVAGIGNDSTTAISGRSGFHSVTAASNAPIYGDYTKTAIGFHYFQALEGSSAGTATFFGDSGLANIQTGLAARLRM